MQTVVLLADCVVGLISPMMEASRPGHARPAPRPLPARPLPCWQALLVHSIVYLLGTYDGSRRSSGSTDAEWVEVGGKVKRKAFRFEFWSMTLIAVAAWFGGHVVTSGKYSIWHLATASLALAFLGAFVVRYAVIAWPTRLAGGQGAGRPARALYGPGSRRLPGGDRRPMKPLAIVVVVLVDLLGFTINDHRPAGPFARHYGFSPAQIGLLMAAFPMCRSRRRADPGSAERPVRSGGPSSSPAEPARRSRS